MLAIAVLKQVTAALFGLALLVGAADARIPRSHAAIDAFKREHPCPANGNPSGPCPGWIVDHVIALACGGPDQPGNMQWQTVAAAKAKDKIERKGKNCKQKEHAT